MKPTFEFALSWAPTSALSVVDPFGDIGFSLTHLALSDIRYAAWYRRYVNGIRVQILDNSFHELGDSVTIKALKQAAEFVYPDIVCAPDRIGEAEWTVRAYADACDEFGPMLESMCLAAVVTGGNAGEMYSCFEEYNRMPLVKRPEVVCLPYKLDRVGFLRKLAANHKGMHAFVTQITRWHLFGYNDLAELLDCMHLLQEIGKGGGRWVISLDTAKPLTYALRDHRKPMPKTTKSGQAERVPQDYAMTVEELSRTAGNIQLLRSWVAATNWSDYADEFRNRTQPDR